MLAYNKPSRAIILFLNYILNQFSLYYNFISIFVVCIL